MLLAPEMAALHGHDAAILALPVRLFNFGWW
jgi:hypothetical protein